MRSATPYLPATHHVPCRVGIFMSGNGTNAEKLLEHSLTGNAYRVAALFTDRPVTSRAGEIAERYGIALLTNDIKAFYARHGARRVTIATGDGRRLREQWTDEVRTQFCEFPIDFAVFAGFVPLTNLTRDWPCLNVHPGDLTYLKDRKRYLIGLHTMPVERAILEGLTFLRSSVIIATPYDADPEDMDSGPILGLSDRVDIDLSGFTLESLQATAALRPSLRPRAGFGDDLESVAHANLERLKTGGDWLVLPRVVDDFAAGRFGTGEGGRLCYRGEGGWQFVATVEYTTAGPRAIPMSS